MAKVDFSLPLVRKYGEGIMACGSLFVQPHPVASLIELVTDAAERTRMEGKLGLSENFLSIDIANSMGWYTRQRDPKSVAVTTRGIAVGLLALREELKNSPFQFIGGVTNPIMAGFFERMGLDTYTTGNPREIIVLDSLAILKSEEARLTLESLADRYQTILEDKFGVARRSRVADELSSNPTE